MELGKKIHELEESGDYNFDGDFEDVHYTINVTAWISYETSPGDYFVPRLSDRRMTIEVNYIYFINAENEEKTVTKNGLRDLIDTVF